MTEEAQNRSPTSGLPSAAPSTDAAGEAAGGGGGRYSVGTTLGALALALAASYAATGLDGDELYRDLALLLPLALVGVSRRARHRWGCTIAAAVYCAFHFAWLVVLPALAPKLAPLAYKVAHVVPAAFPLFLLAPAAVLDLLRRVPTQRREVFNAAALAGAALVLVEWPATDLSPLAHAPWSGVRSVCDVARDGGTSWLGHLAGSGAASWPLVALAFVGALAASWLGFARPRSRRR